MKSLANWTKNWKKPKAIQRNCLAMQRAWWVNSTRNCLKMGTSSKPSVRSSTMPMKTECRMKSCSTSCQIQLQRNRLLWKRRSTYTVHLSGSLCWKSWVSLQLISLRLSQSSVRLRIVSNWIVCKNQISCLSVSLWDSLSSLDWWSEWFQVFNSLLVVNMYLHGYS